MVLLGPTGTGKTVLLEVIAGLRFPDEGKIFLNSQDAGSLSPEARHLGVVYQDYALFPHLTVYDNIAFGLRLKNEPKVKIHNAVDEMARFLEIDDLLNRRPRHLSGGERQRVALARALVLKPHMLLLDEPLSALDRLTRDRLRRELKRIHSEIRVTVLHITHDLSEAFFLADRLVVMEEGAVVQEGSPQEILKHPVNLFVAELLGIENFIPASVGDEGKALITNLGPMDSGLFFTKPFTEHEDNGAYLWRGKMRVANLNHANGHIEIELEHESGERLRTTLSRREAASLPVPLAVGTEMATGLLREGLHWVPKRSDS
jgi:ABC-type sugar transport system ATPase subunit